MATYQSVGVHDVLIIEPHLARAADSLRAAELLRAEGLCCDAMTRAHQCTVHAERALLATEKRSPQTFRSVHRLATNHFLQPGHLPDTYIAELDTLALQRERADDQPLASATPDEADDALDLARRFLTDTRSLLEQGGYLGAEEDDG